MAGLLNIGLTGLNAAQLQLNTTSHNIANAATPGYNRQGVVQTTNDPLFSGVGFFGQGTRVANVTRQYSQFLENQVLSADNRRSEYATYNAQISQINNLLGDPSAGLSPAIQGFFGAVQEMAANPSSVPARQSLLSAGEALVSRFQSMDARLTEVRQGVEGEIGATVDSINVYAKQIAELNQRILIAQAAGPNVKANDLLDQRNVLVAELNKLVKTTAIEESDGQLSVFIGSGQPLIIGQSVSNIVAVPSRADPSRQTIAIEAQNGQLIYLPERLIGGGTLGGLLDFRRETLDRTQNQLGLIALSISNEFNAIHRLGIDLDGLLGGDFFRAPSPVVTPAEKLAVEISDLSQLTGSDYVLARNGADYTLTRASDGRIFSVDPASAENTYDGLQFTSFALADGDSVLIQPARFAARDIAMGINDPRRIAAASPVISEVPVANAGNARVSAIEMVAISSVAVPSFELSWDGSNLTVPATPAGITLDPSSYDPLSDATGKVFTATVGTTEFSFTLSGTPKVGDVFQFKFNTDGVADNRNAVRLGALQVEKTMQASATGAPTATFQSAYSQLVSFVGNKAREVQVGEQAQETLLRQAMDARESLSGVNLDEEAANLIRYQQAYQASGRVMSIAQRLFDELISIAR